MFVDAADLTLLPVVVDFVAAVSAVVAVVFDFGMNQVRDGFDWIWLELVVLRATPTSTHQSPAWR